MRPIYAVYNLGGGAFYTQNSSSSATTPTLSYQLNGALSTAQEFVQAKDLYQLFRLGNIEVQLYPTISYVNNYFDSLPPLYFQVVPPYLSSALQANTAYLADNHIEFMPTQVVKSKIYNYTLPEVFLTNSGVPVGGSGIWQSLASYSPTDGYSLIHGYQTLPTTTNTSAVIIQVAEVRINIMITFANAIKITV